MRWALAGECGIVFVVGALGLYLLDQPGALYLVWAAIAFLPSLIGERAPAAGYALLRIYLPLVFGALFVAGYHAAHATVLVKPLLMQPLNEYNGEQYYAVISTLFAIITALILVKGIEGFDRLNAVIGEEADQIRSIVEFLYYFEEEDGEVIEDIEEVRRRTRRIRELLADYCAAALEDPGGLRRNGAYDLLRRIAREIGALECNDENDRLALAEVMRGVNQLFTIRARRIAFSQFRVPLYMVVALAFMSLAIILPFFIGAPETHPYADEFIFVLTAFCVFILIVLQDINTPFDGFWKVDVQPLEDLDHDLQAELSAKARRAPRVFPRPEWDVPAG